MGGGPERLAPPPPRVTCREAVAAGRWLLACGGACLRGAWPCAAVTLRTMASVPAAPTALPAAVPESYSHVLAELECLDPLLSALRLDSARLKVCDERFAFSFS